MQRMLDRLRKVKHQVVWVGYRKVIWAHPLLDQLLDRELEPYLRLLLRVPFLLLLPVLLPLERLIDL
jgi:hypothetical protein